MDKISPERRSLNMARIRSKDTRPELLVRRLVYRMGFRYRLHRRDLPGKPDLVFASRRKAIFVHGCFWHAHDSPKCPDRRPVKSNVEYWSPKLARNRERDAQHVTALRTDGWRVLTLWECELNDTARLAKVLRRFLSA